MAMINTAFWEGKRVFVTGHTGFKGSWLLNWLLLMRSDVTGFSLEPEFNSLFSSIWGELNAHDLPFRSIVGDIRDFTTLQSCVRDVNPEIVIHLAAQPLVRKSYQDPLGTWSTNVQGSLTILESLKQLNHHCSVVMVTTDKVYENQEWMFGYRENDRLGGHDPYSASKAAAEIAISSWRSSFCGDKPHQNSNLNIASARAGNVIGGGDWSSDRIVPDVVKSLINNTSVTIRNPSATRPWQHVLEPLSGYLVLAEALYQEDDPPCEAFNFGPTLDSNRSVSQLVETIFSHWPGTLNVDHDQNALHEAGLLHLQSDKACQRLNWQPTWDYELTVQKTIEWYLYTLNRVPPQDQCISDIHAFINLTS